MRIVEQSHEILSVTPDALRLIETAGRTCYKSEDRATDESAADFVRMIIRRGHESVLEHASMTVRFITDRGVSHELVRHRLASFSQESTRYVDYGKKGFEFVRPYNVSSKKQDELLAAFERGALPAGDIAWITTLIMSEASYEALREDLSWTPQEARAVLPNSLKTEVVMTANMREWRHVLKLRCAKDAHPQMRALMRGLYLEVAGGPLAPLFEDLEAPE